MEYEVIFEIFNSCSGNQMRDIFFDEMEFDSHEEMEKYIRSQHNYTIGEMEKTELEDGGIIYNYVVGGVPQRYTFTPIG